jgi:hypothetical protein
VLIIVDDRIQRSRLDKPFLHQQGFERLDPQFCLGRRILVVMPMGMRLIRIATHERLALRQTTSR